MTEPTDHPVRPARARDLPHLAAIEDSGLALFEAALGDLAGTALAATAPSGEARADQPGFVMVAGDLPVGFAHVLFLQGHAHLEQLSVHPDHGRRGIGRALVEAVCERLAARGHGSLTLATYADLPWNAPLYARWGFVEMVEGEPVPGHLRDIRPTEQRLGLDDHGRRVLMRRPLRRHRTTDEMTAFLTDLDAHLGERPREHGAVRLVVRRPALGEREVLTTGQFEVEAGLVGDSWAERGSSRTDDGSAHPDMQLNVISHPWIEFLAQDPEREALAGDQLHLDLDLSEANLPAGTELHLGGDSGAVVVVTEQPHTGCGKFIARYGKEAMVFVNSPEGRERRLRGLCARVLRPGPVSPGDDVLVVRPHP